MNTTRIAIFIDGAYLEYILKTECSGIKVDFAAFAKKMANGIDVLRSYYYNCLPYQRPNPTPDEAERFAQAQKFQDALNNLPRFQVRNGMLVYRGNDDKGKPIYVQKGVDILMGVDLVLLAAKQQISHAAVVAGDSDFIPALKAAKNEGVLVHLFHGRTPHRSLVSEADERTMLTGDFFKDIMWTK